MKVIKGEWSGKSARLTRSFLGGPILVVARQKFRLPGDFKTIKPLAVDDRRTTGQNLFLLVIALTVIGIPIAILLALLWRPVNATVGFRLNTGQEFIALMQKAEYTALKPFLGITDTF